MARLEDKRPATRGVLALAAALSTVGGCEPAGEGWAPGFEALPTAPQSADVKPVDVTPTAQDAPLPTIRYVPHSTHKLEQLIGDIDKERRQPTRTLSQSRFGLEGTDLGSPFEHAGRLYLLFGDTLGVRGGALDAMGATDATNPEQGVTLDFLLGGGTYLTVEPRGVSMGGNEVPSAGIDVGGRVYVTVKTNHHGDAATDVSLLTRFDPPRSFEPLRVLSRLPAGHFVMVTMHAAPADLDGLPPGGPYVLIWGQGEQRHSDSYLQIVPAAHIEDGAGTLYFGGIEPSGAVSWRAQESEAVPIQKSGVMTVVSVTWCKELGVWLLVWKDHHPGRGGTVNFTYSRKPWGPWAAPQVLFNKKRDHALGKYMHDPQASPDDGQVGPVIGKPPSAWPSTIGVDYAPFVVERWTKVRGSQLDIYFTLSIWNPYVVELMKSSFTVNATPAPASPGATTPEGEAREGD